MIFGRRKKEQPTAPDAEREDDVAEDEPEHDAGGDEDVGPVEPEVDIDRSWRDRAEAVIPGGSSTGSKRPSAMYGESEGPTHFAAAHGCHVRTAGGEDLIDCTMALGSVALGYGDESVANAVAMALGTGTVSGLSSVLEVQLAERLCDLIPCAERALFFKSGGEGMSAAVRLARTATGRDHVVGSGYFGWQDWSSSEAGVPAGTRAAFTRVPFDDIAALDRACQESDRTLAAIAIEPVIEKLPSEAWIAAARGWCERSGAVLIFDEIKTGFRLHTAGYQGLSGVEPDLAVFSKALANGYPLAAVVGRADIMDATSRTWISSTLGGESIGLAAALAVLDAHDRMDVCQDLAFIGRRMLESVRTAIEASRCPGVEVDGLPQMWLMRFDDPARESRFLELARAQGVLLKRGAYNFAALAHDDETLIAIEAAVSTALVELRQETE